MKSFEFGEPTAISRLHLMMVFATHPPKASFKIPGVLCDTFEFGEPTAISRLHLMMTFATHPPKASFKISWCFI